MTENSAVSKGEEVKHTLCKLRALLHHHTWRHFQKLCWLGLFSWLRTPVNCVFIHYCCRLLLGVNTECHSKSSWFWVDSLITWDQEDKQENEFSVCSWKGRQIMTPLTENHLKWIIPGRPSSQWSWWEPSWLLCFPHEVWTQTLFLQKNEGNSVLYVFI